MTAPLYPTSISAHANLTSATAALAAGSVGCTSAVHNGTGDNTINLAEALDPTEMTVSAVANGATGAIVAVEKVSDGVIRVRTFDAAGVAADVDTSVTVWRVKV